MKKNNKLYNKLFLLFLIFVSIILNYNSSYNSNNKKKLKKSSIIINTLHNFFSVPLMFYSLILGNHLQHTILLLIMLIIWYIYDGKCPVTLSVNKNNQMNQNERLKDLIYYIEQITGIHYYYYYLFVLIFNFVMIYINDPIHNTY
jgi:CDP-diglyceride synthetase